MVDSTLIREAFLSELENSSVETKRVRLLWCNQWLSFVEGKSLSDWNKGLVTTFRTKLENEKKNGKPKYKTLTIRGMLQVVSRVFDAAKDVHEKEKLKIIQTADPKDPAAMTVIIQAMSAIPPQSNFGKRWLPEAQTEDRDHPAISIEDLKKLIDAAKAGKLGDAECAFLALASIYGLRKGELITILPEHINYEAGTIWFDTEKHGEKRCQLLVKEIIPYLKKYKFDLQYSSMKMHSMFIRMCNKAGVKLIRHQGWHSLRRRLDTDILDSLSSDINLHKHAEYLVHSWHRWRISGNMVERYYSTEEADKIVITHHPVTRLWK
jgi:integrase